MNKKDYGLFVKRLARETEPMTDAQRASSRLMDDVQRQKKLDAEKIKIMSLGNDGPNLGGDAFDLVQ